MTVSAPVGLQERQQAQPAIGSLVEGSERRRQACTLTDAPPLCCRRPSCGCPFTARAAGSRQVFYSKRCRVAYQRRGAAGRIPDDPDAHGPSRPAGSGAPRAADEFLAFRRRGRHWTQDSHDHHEPQPIARYLAEEGSDPRNGDDYPMTSLSDGLGREKETITP